MRSDAPSPTTEKSQWHKKVALEEYWVLQEKLDKIGDFKFRIRGWSITLISGVVMTSFSTNTSPLLVAFAFPIVLLFQALEGYQSVLQKILGKRIMAVERTLRPGLDERTFSSPGIGRAVSAALNKSNRAPTRFVKFCTMGDAYFYYLLHVLVAVCLIVKFAQAVDWIAILSLVFSWVKLCLCP